MKKPGIWILLAFALTGCATHHKSVQVEELRRLASAWNTETNASRITTAKKIVAVLPVCPLRTRHLGMERWNDWEHPSYKLYRSDLIQILGEPSEKFALAAIGDGLLLDGVSHQPWERVGSTEFMTYYLGSDTNESKHELVVALYNEYIVASAVETRYRVEHSKTLPHRHSLVIPGSTQ